MINIFLRICIGGGTRLAVIEAGWLLSGDNGRMWRQIRDFKKIKYSEHISFQKLCLLRDIDNALLFWQIICQQNKLYLLVIVTHCVLYLPFLSERGACLHSTDQLTSTSTLASVNRMIGAARNTVKTFGEVLHHQYRIVGASSYIHSSSASFSDPKVKAFHTFSSQISVDKLISGFWSNVHGKEGWSSRSCCKEGCWRSHKKSFRKEEVGRWEGKEGKW